MMSVARLTDVSTGKGNFMSKKIESHNIDKLLTEADELVQQINTDALNDMKEEHRLQFEKHAQNLEKIKSEVQGRIAKKEASDMGAGAKGMHEALLDIVKAMGELKSYLS
jgi:vacuolar-type H+-ATPase subunit H